MRTDLEGWVVVNAESCAEVRERVISAIDKADKVQLVRLYTDEADKIRFLNELEESPLSYAAGKDSSDIVKLLLRLNVTINASNQGALTTALEHDRHLNVALLLPSKTSDMDFLAVICNHAPTTSIKCFTLLLQRLLMQETSESQLFKIAEIAITNAENFSAVIDEISDEVDLKILLEKAIKQDLGQACKILLKKIQSLDRVVIVEKNKYNKVKRTDTFIKTKFNFIMFAIHCNSLNAIKALYDSGKADFNISSHVNQETMAKDMHDVFRGYCSLEGHQPPLNYAIKIGRTEIALFLCSQRQININLRETIKSNAHYSVLEKCKESTSSSLDHAVKEGNLAVVKALLNRSDLNLIISHSDLGSGKEDYIQIMIALMLHDRIEKVERTDLNTSEALAVYHSRYLLNSTNECDLSSDQNVALFNEIVFEAYRRCPIVILNRVINMIAKHPDQIPTKHDHGVIKALLQMQKADPIFKEIAKLLGMFIYPEEKLFDRRFELTILFLGHVQDDMDARQMFNNSLFLLANCKAFIDRRPLNELLNDQSTRSMMLTGLAKANLYRVSLHKQMAIDKEYVELSFQANPEPFSVMWNLANWYASENTMGPESADELVQRYEKLTNPAVSSVFEGTNTRLLQENFSAMLASRQEEIITTAITKDM